MLLASKFGIFNLFGNPSALYGDVKSISYTVSKTCPAPLICAPLLNVPQYLKSSLSPYAGTVIEKSTNATEGLCPGSFKPYVLAIL